MAATSTMVALGETLRRAGYQEEKRVAANASVTDVRAGRVRGDEEDADAEDDEAAGREVADDVGIGMVGGVVEVG